MQHFNNSVKHLKKAIYLIFNLFPISYKKNPWETILPVVAGIYLRLHLDCKLDSDF